MATVSQDVLTAFKAVSKRNNTLDWAIYSFSENGTDIIVEATGVKGETTFDDFKTALPKKDAR